MLHYKNFRIYGSKEDIINFKAFGLRALILCKWLYAPEIQFLILILVLKIILHNLDLDKDVILYNASKI